VLVVDSVDGIGAGAFCGMTLNAGSGSCTLVFATGGQHVLTAGYAGDGTSAPGSGSTQVFVDQIFADSFEPCLGPTCR